MSPVVQHLIHSLHAEVIIHRQLAIEIRHQDDQRAQHKRANTSQNYRLMQEGARRTEISQRAIEDYKHLIQYHQLFGKEIP